MADIFDEIAAGSATTSASSQTGDIFDQIASEAVPHSEVRAVANDALRGIGGFLSLVDEINPISTSPLDKTIFGFKIPHLFGLGPERTEPAFMDIFTPVSKSIGVMTEDKPQTETGKFAGNVAENVAAALPFGLPAAIINGVFGGTGGYLGESIAGPEGRTVGSFLGGISPAGVSKLGIIKELGEALGPTASQVPIFRSIFGDAPVQAAVGRALNTVAENPKTLESALIEIANTPNAPTKLDQFKTTAELVGDPGIARAEDAISSMIPNSGFKTQAVNRAAAREEEVLKGYDPTQNAYDTSKSLEQTITDSVTNIEAVENATWKALPKDTPVYTKIGTLEKNLVDSIDNVTYSGALPIQGEAKALLKTFNDATSEGAVSLGVIQKLRSQALGIKRDTASMASEADRTANRIANVIQSHLIDIVDKNVEAGTISEDVASLWRGGRAITKAKINTFGAPSVGSENAGTKAIEQLALKGQALDNTTLLREGLNSPDKLAAHIQAAAAGGQDVKPLYQQALKAELDGKPQSQWANIIDRKKTQWKMVFSPEEMARVDRNLADIEAQRIASGKAFVGNSATNPRGNVQSVINAKKGLASLSTGLQNATTLGLTIEGARRGWNKGETLPGSIGNALLYGSIGALAGKGIRSATSSASEKFDSIFTAALKDPNEALKAIQAAKPSQLKQALAGAVISSAKATGARATGTILNKLSRDLFQPKEEQASKQEIMKSQKEVEAEIDSDPYYSALYEFESGRNPKAKNPNSSAKGAFQFIDSTAKALGVTDPFDIEQSFEAVKKMDARNVSEFGDSPGLRYAAHYLGETTLRKLLKGERLSPKQFEIVKDFKDNVLPKFEKVYSKISNRILEA